MDLRERLRHGVRHPWEVARARFFVDVLVRAGVTGDVLDVGAGDGYFAGCLARRVRAVTAFDPHYKIEDAGPPVTFTATLPSRPFDALTLLDVLEHVPDDRAMLSDILRLLKPGGFLLASVPAFPSLFTAHDVALGHHRRYRLAHLRALIAVAGLSVVASGGVFHALLLARAVAKLVELGRGVRARPAPEDAPPSAETATARWRHGRLPTSLVTLVLGLDTAVTRALAATGASAPGLSAWALARKGP